MQHLKIKTNAAAKQPMPVISDQERRVFLAAQIAYSADQHALDIFDTNAVVTLGARYLEHGYSAATCYEKAMETIRNIAMMNKLIQQGRLTWIRAK